jgi:hypothetical protein
MPDFAPSPESGGLAAKLAEARRRMAGLDVPRPLAARLHRQFIAICDAVKAPGADEAIGERRLAVFLAVLERGARGTTGEQEHEQEGPDRRGFRPDGRQEDGH